MNNDNRKSRIAMKLSAALITTTALTMAVSAAGYANYVVQPGDNLTSIARAHNTTVNAIVSANNLKNADLIYVAQRLAIPTGHHNIGTPVNYQPVLEATVSDVSHTVVAGDTLNKLAAKYNTTVAYLVSANGICNANIIEVGQVLNIGKSVTYTQLSTTTPTVSEYTVVAGDTLNNIARKFNTSARHLAAVNNISDINVIQVGQVLNVGYSTGYYHSYTVRSASGAEMTDSEFEALADMPAVEAGATVEALAVVAETPVETAEVYEVEVEVEATEFVEEIAFAVEIPAEEITLPEFVEEVEEEAGFDFEPEPEVELPTEVVEETLSAVEVEPEVAFNEYRVTETSSVFHLAALFNTTVAELLQWNNIPDTNNIPAGTVLQVSV